MTFNTIYLLLLGYEYVGCFKDKNSSPSERTLPVLDNKDPRLMDYFKARDYPLDKCYAAALEKGLRYFSLQNGGRCFGGGDTYKKYGTSTGCEANGKGGPLASSVYKIKPGFIFMLCTVEHDGMPGMGGGVKLKKIPMF